MNKLKVYEGFILEIVKWYSQYNDIRLNDLNTLKLSKLFFFISSLNSELLNYFKFHAMPLGPVDSDLVLFMKLMEFQTIKINHKGLVHYNDKFNYQDNIIVQFKNSIQELDDINPEIINYSAFKLIDLSHKWFSWSSNFEFAKRINKLKYPITRLEILNEPNKQYIL